MTVTRDNAADVAESLADIADRDDLDESAVNYISKTLKKIAAVASVFLNVSVLKGLLIPTYSIHLILPAH